MLDDKNHNNNPVLSIKTKKHLFLLTGVKGEFYYNEYKSLK